MERFEVIEKLFPVKMRRLLGKYSEFSKINEIRIRVNQPVIFCSAGEEHYLSVSGGTTGSLSEAYRITQNEMRELLEYACNYAIYAYEEQLRQGYLTIRGGHRIGVNGSVAVHEQKVTAMKHISSVNIRIAHEVIGCGNEVLPYIFEGQELCNTLVISPPGVGKTTLLRDIVRNLSNGASGYAGRNVCVVDERSEIAASHLGVPQNDVGIRTDVLDGCPKTVGMYMVVRSMAPQVVVVDEIGGEQDVQALEYLFKCGCSLVASVHGNSYHELSERKLFEGLMERELFQRFVVLHRKSDGSRRMQIFSQQGRCLYE